VPAAVSVSANRAACIDTLALPGTSAPLRGDHGPRPPIGKGAARRPPGSGGPSGPATGPLLGPVRHPGGGGADRSAGTRSALYGDPGQPVAGEKTPGTRPKTRTDWSPPTAQRRPARPMRSTTCATCSRCASSLTEAAASAWPLELVRGGNGAGSMPSGRLPSIPDESWAPRLQGHSPKLDAARQSLGAPLAGGRGRGGGRAQSAPDRPAPTGFCPDAALRDIVLRVARAQSVTELAMIAELPDGIPQQTAAAQIPGADRSRAAAGGRCRHCQSGSVRKRLRPSCCANSRSSTQQIGRELGMAPGNPRDATGGCSGWWTAARDGRVPLFGAGAALFIGQRPAAGRSSAAPATLQEALAQRAAGSGSDSSSAIRRTGDIIDGWRLAVDRAQGRPWGPCK